MAFGTWLCPGILPSFSAPLLPISPPESGAWKTKPVCYNTSDTPDPSTLSDFIRHKARRGNENLWDWLFHWFRRSRIFASFFLELWVLGAPVIMVVSKRVRSDNVIHSIRCRVSVDVVGRRDCSFMARGCLSPVKSRDVEQMPVVWRRGVGWLRRR